MATVNPALVLGPVLGADFSESIQVIERLITGRLPGIPRLGFNLVDVRDVADLHLKAMTAPQAAGQRFIAASDWAWMADLAALLKAKLGPDGAKVPTRKVPDFVLRLAALFDKDIGAVVGGLGKRHEASSAKAQKMLGWTPRSAEVAALDCARSLVASGLV
jgi:dihydroflavonol-4-reductase